MLKSLANARIATKLFAGFGVVVVITLVVGLAGAVSTLAVERALVRVYTDGTQPMIELGHLMGDFQRVRVALRDAILENEPQQVAEAGQRARAAIRDISDPIARFEKTIRNEQVRDRFDQFKTNWAVYQTDALEMVRLAEQNDDDAARQVMNGPAREVAKSVDTLLVDMSQMKVQLAGQEYLSARRTALALLGVVGVCALAAAAVSVVVGVVLSRTIRSNLRTLQAGAHAIVEGDLSTEVTFRSQCEFGALADDFRKLHGFLRQTVSTLRERSTTLMETGGSMAATSHQLAANVEETTAKVTAAATAAEEVNRSIQSVATGAEEMSATIKEGASCAASAASAASQAVEAAQGATDTVRQLSAASDEIGQIVQIIAGITDQTNLLALNATIEAARAGESGKGFAVVANEVKQLAVETRNATRTIEEKISTMQERTTMTMQAIDRVTAMIARISDANTQVANVVEEQSATAAEMTRNMNEAARDSGQVAENLARVSDATRHTADAAATTRGTAAELSQISAELSQLVAIFRLGAEAPAAQAAFHSPSQIPAHAAVHTAAQADAPSPPDKPTQRLTIAPAVDLANDESLDLRKAA